MMGESKIKEFLEALSSAQPAPGGGAASALVGSIAASLVCKVSALTIGKKKYQGVQEEVKEIYEKSRSLEEQLLKLADMDSEAFNKIIEAYRSAKELDDENEKQKVIEEATKEACVVPLETAELSYEVMKLSERITAIGNRNAFTDGLTASYLAFSAINGALENVFFNLKNISADKEFLIKTKERAENLKKLSEQLFDEAKGSAEEVKKGWS